MIETALQPLALVRAACELISIKLPEADDELLMAVAEGQGFELDVEGLPGIGLRVERQGGDAALTVSARAPEAAEEPDWLAGAMLANHVLRDTARRYSLDPADGALVISESIPLEGATPDGLAALMSELAMALNTALGGDDDVADDAATSTLPGFNPVRG